MNNDTAALVARAQAALEGTTPGPWAAKSDPCHFDTISDIHAGGKLIAQTCNIYPMIEADARLIASAPTLIADMADALTAQAAELALARECIANLEEMQARDEAALAAAEARVAVLEGALMDIRSHYTSDQGAYAGIVARAYLKRGAA